MMYKNREFSAVIRYLGLATMMIAALVVVGWLFNIQALTTWFTGIKPMNPMSAVMFLLCGIWCMINNDEQERSKWQIIVWITLLFGLIHFLTYFIPADFLRADYFLFGGSVRNDQASNLISPTTALNFLIWSLVAVTNTTNDYKWRWAQQILLILSFFLAYISVLGYAFNIQPIYRMDGLRPMPLVSSMCFIFLDFALFFKNRRFGLAQLYTSRYTGGKLMRRIIPFVLVLPPLLEYIRFKAETKGLFSGEFGVELSSFIFTLSLLVFISFNASFINRSEYAEKQNTIRFRTLMESLHEGILEFDDYAIIQYCNPAFERIFGYKAADIIGTSAIDLMVPQKDRQLFEQRLTDRNAGKTEYYTNEFLTKKGEKKFVSIHAQPLPDAKGNFKGTVVSFHDITAEKLHLQDLEAFTGSAAHDLNSPIASIQMLLQGMNKEGLTQEQDVMINYAVETTQRVGKLLRDLLEFSRWGEKEVVKKQLDTGWIVREIFDLFDTSKFKMVMETLPTITGNDAGVKMVFTNLISNAVKYSSNVESPEVEVGSYKKDGRTWFFVADNGIGIEAMHMAHLFTPFKRFTSGFEGNGLGLAIVKRIVEKHGGSIVARNRESGGMTFDFTLEPDQYIKH